MKTLKHLLVTTFVILSTLTASAENIKVYINPGHGSWCGNCRPMATINYAAGDTLGFFESNTNLWKGLALREKLEAAGGYDVKMSRTACGPAGSTSTANNAYNRSLSEIAQEVESWNADYFISIHSNAATEGTSTNYPAFFYRGTDASDYAKGSKAMAQATWPLFFEIHESGFEPNSAYTKTKTCIRGDISFWNSSSTVNGYTGYYGVLKHGSPGFLPEGYFHTYQPARHRALNTDWCRQEGVRYFRGIQAYYGREAETVGYILGAVRTKSETMTHSLYKYKSGTNDQYKPINGAKVVLRNSTGKLIRCNCYPYVKRTLQDQPYYTTDHNWNGVFMFENLEPGTYSISVHKEGYADYTGTVTVTANQTTYPQIFIEPGTGTEPNVDDAGGSAGETVFAEKIEMAQIYVNQSIADALNGKTIRRAVYGNGVMYILAVDVSKNPTLLAVDPTTHSVISELATSFCVVNSPDGYKLSDIALTSDGVLIGCSMDTVCHIGQYGSSTPWNLYKWTRNGNTWTGSKWFSRASNETSGNYYHAMTGSTIAYSGSLENGTILTTAYSTAGTTKNMRLVRYQIANGEYSSEMRNNFPNTGDNANKFSAADDKYGAEHQLTVSLRGSNRYVLSSKTKPAFEFAFTTSSTGAEPTFTGTSPSVKYGANYTTYLTKPLMIAPKTDGSGNNMGVEVYDITNGLNNAILIETTNTDLPVSTPSYAMAAAQVEEKDITLYLLKDNSLSTFTSKGVAQGIVPRICAYNLNVTADGSDYVFTFDANTDARTANIVFYDQSSGDSVGSLPLNDVVKGENSFTIPAADLPGLHDQVLNWSVDLETYAVTEWNKVDSTKSDGFTRPFISINNSPESPYFQYLYIAERQGASNANNGLYAFKPDYTPINATAYKGGRSVIGSIYRSYVDDQGYVWFADGSDGYSGILVADPANLSGTFSEFFVGTRQSGGLIKNGNIEVGSSCLGLSIYGTGEGAKLLAINEDGGSTLKSFSLAIYNIGKSSGIYAHTWDKAPSSNFALSGMAAIDGYPLGCSHGVWIATRRSGGQNNDGARALQFYDWNGNIQLNSAVTPYVEQIKGSYSGACALSSDEKVLYFVNESGNIMVWDITWIGDKPNMTLRYTYETDLTSIREMHFDYAGNLVCSGEDEDITVYTIPTQDNHTKVPARKALTVTCKNGIGIRVSSVTINKESIRLGEGQTETLTANILPVDATQEEVTWRSTNETIASVSSANGVVTGNKAGQTQIIVTTMDGGYSDTCDVTVYGYMSDAEAQRIWAYDLRLKSNLDTHTFNFKSVADATDGYLVFLNEAGAEMGRYQLDHVVRGANSITLTDQDIPTPNIRLNWGVELHADAIKETATLVEITDQSTGKYKFYFPQGVAVDNNPESNYFGQLYVAAATSGDNADSNRESQQQAGLFIFDPLLHELNPINNSGIIPSNVTFDLTYSASNISTRRQQMHRIAVDPVTHKVAFAYYLNSATGAYAMDPANFAGAATNLVAGAGDITKVNSLCFDKEGTLYVMDNADYVANVSTGRIYKVQNGVTSQFSKWYGWASFDNAIVSDGRGGLWVAQFRSNFDGFVSLSHLNSAGRGDFCINNVTNTALLETYTSGSTTNGSYRGQVAYNEREDILAFGGGRVVQLFKVSYDANGVPTLTKFAKTEPLAGGYQTNIDGIAFDYAGDLYVASAWTEKMYKFAVPTEDNICLVPAQKSQIIDKRLNLRDTEDNSIKLNDAIDQTTNVRVFRTLTSGMYNTICLPFDLATLDGTPLAGAELLELQQVDVRETETTQDIRIHFSETTTLEAGVPYLIQPTLDITDPMVFDAVTISTVEGSFVGEGILTFNGILSPMQMMANNKSVLFLVENNVLAWPNATAYMNGMRAYFQLPEQVGEEQALRMSARISVDRGTASEDIIILIPQEENAKAAKIMRNGMIYIIRNGEMYNMHGIKVN